MWKIAIQFLLLHTISTNGCYTACPAYHFKPYSIRTEVLKLLPDDRNMSDVALIGTYGSAIKSHQNLNISEQLKYGVRVLDITIRATSNKFAIHDGIYFSNQMFGHAINIVLEFLDDNPKEFVIILMREVHFPGWDVTKNNCAILDSYLTPNMLKSWSLNARIKEYRGKILFATINDRSFENCVVNLRSSCRLSSDYHVNKFSKLSSGELDRKAVEFTMLQDASFFEDYQCFINVISMTSDQKNYAKMIAMQGSGVFYCLMPMNVRVANTFLNPHRALVIVMADFPNQELIDIINDSNDQNNAHSGWDDDAHYEPEKDIINFLTKIY